MIAAYQQYRAAGRGQRECLGLAVYGKWAATRKDFWWRLYLAISGTKPGVAWRFRFLAFGK